MSQSPRYFFMTLGYVDFGKTSHSELLTRATLFPTERRTQFAQALTAIEAAAVQ